MGVAHVIENSVKVLRGRGQFSDNSGLFQAIQNDWFVVVMYVCSKE